MYIQKYTRDMTGQKFKLNKKNIINTERYKNLEKAATKKDSKTECII